MPWPAQPLVRHAASGLMPEVRWFARVRRPPEVGRSAYRPLAPGRLLGGHFRRITTGPEFNPWSPGGRPNEEAEMKRLLVFACAAPFGGGAGPPGPSRPP